MASRVRGDRNTVYQNGNLARDPVSFTEKKSGRLGCRFTIVTNGVFVDVTTFGKLATRAKKLKKGMYVEIKGKLFNKPRKTGTKKILTAPVQALSIKQPKGES